MSDDDKLAMIQALVLHGANKEAVKALKSFRNEIKKRGVSQKQSKDKVMDKSTKAVLIMTFLFVFLLADLSLMLYFNINKSSQIERLEKEKIELAENKTALKSQLAVKNLELITAKKDLNEAHEMMGVLFLEAMSVTDEFNKLKKSKCKVRK